MTQRALIRWELRDSLRGPWFLVSAAVLVGGGLALLFVGTSSAILGSRGFARSLAGLVHLGLFVVPLMALLPSTGSIAGDRELGNMSYLLAQPLDRRTVYRSRWLGISTALGLALLTALGSIGLFAALRGVSSTIVLALSGLTLALAAAFVSIGLAISAVCRSRSRATALGLTVWFVSVALGSLGVMTSFVRFGAPAWTLEAWAILNPVEAYRLAALAVLDAGPGLVGPVGSALETALGASGVVLAATASLVAWSGAAFWIGLRRFDRADF